MHQFAGNSSGVRLVEREDSTASERRGIIAPLF
jgi:hypothetical protein